MEALDRKNLLNVGLVVIVCGAVVTLFASGISKDPMVLTFGIGPMLLGLVLVLTGFFGPKKAAGPLPVWKTLIMPLPILSLVLPRLLFDYRFPYWSRPYVLVAAAIICAVALWPIQPNEQRSPSQARE